MSIPTEISLSWPQALSWRLARHFLAPVGSASVAEVVARLGAVASMDHSLAELAVATRRTQSRPGDLARAAAEGSIIEVFAFRGAVHYLTPIEGAAFLALRCAGRQWELKSWVEHYRLSADAWPDFRATVRAAVRNGPLTLQELGEAVTSQRAYRHLRPVFREGAVTLIKPLTWQGDLSFGPSREGKATFQGLEANPQWPGLPDLEVAGPAAITAYLRSYGPATPDHLHYWLGEGLSAGRRRIEGWLTELEPHLVGVEVDGASMLLLAEDAEDAADAESLHATKPSDVVRFLPGHDQWVMGPGTKDRHITPAPLRQAMTRKANPVVAGGVVQGTWAREGDRLIVRWLSSGAAPQSALAEECHRLGGLLGRDLDLTVARGPA